MSKDLQIMNRLADLASERPPVFRAQICAMITIRNKPVAVGYNQSKTHPFAARFSKHEEAVFMHAEHDCIRQTLREVDPEDLKKATIYIGRVRQDNSWGLAKPCPGCLRAILHYGIKRVVYSLDEKGKFGEMEPSLTK